MKPYFILSIISIMLVIIFDRLFKTNLFKSKKFWKFQVLIIVLTTMVDSYSSGRPIVIFNPDAVTDIRFFHIPLENYLFGFSLITLNLILFEWLTHQKQHE